MNHNEPMADTIRLGDIAHARSGDKGSHANVGVIAYDAHGFEHLRAVLSAEAVRGFFEGLGATKVDRYELPGIRALNFVLRDILQGGASQSLRSDSQGKILGLAILEMEIPAP